MNKDKLVKEAQEIIAKGEPSLIEVMAIFEKGDDPEPIFLLGKIGKKYIGVSSETQGAYEKGSDFMIYTYENIVSEGWE